MPRFTGPKRFVGVDGEAISDEYVLFAAGSESLINRNGITLTQALAWLAQRRAGARFVGFSLHYDFSMMVRGYRDDLIMAMMRGEPVQVGVWHVSYYPKRILRAVTQGTLVEVFDVWSFFTSSFEEALKRMSIQDPGIIAWGKAERGRFSWRQFHEIMAYNTQECRLLEEMCRMLESGMLRQEIRITSWHGPGALADAVLKKAGVKGELERSNLGMDDLFARAYFGGRIETMKIGSFTGVQTYDINSAYPEATGYLWDQTKGEWERTPEWEANRYPVSLWHLEWGLPPAAYIGPLPFRRSDGRIYFPARGRGWYWWPEAQIAMRLHPEVRVLEGRIWTGPHSTRLSAVVRDLYQRRLALKAEKREVEGHVLKLAMNSLYGKMAQTVGRAPWHSQAWAGYVTSFARARLREAVIGYEKEVIAFATDGISVSGRISLPVAEGESLGQWKRETGWDALVLGSGLYRLRRGNEIRTGTRGGSRIDWDDVLNQLNRQSFAVVRDTVFITPMLAILMPHAFGEHRGKWLTRERTLAPWMDKKAKRSYQWMGIGDWGRDSADSTILDGWNEDSQPFEADWSSGPGNLRSRPELLLHKEEV